MRQPLAQPMGEALLANPRPAPKDASGGQPNPQEMIPPRHARNELRRTTARKPRLQRIGDPAEIQPSECALQLLPRPPRGNDNADQELPTPSGPT